MIFHHLARRQNRFRSVAAVIAAAGIAQGGLWDDSKDLTNSANSLYFNQPKPEDQERRKRTKSFSRILAKAMQNPPQGLPGKIMI